MFTGGSFGITVSCPSHRRCRPSRCDRLSRPRSTTAAPPRPDPIGRRWTQPQTAPPAAGIRVRTGTVPMFTAARSMKEEPCCYPCGIATANPQHFTVASWQSWIKPPESSPGADQLTCAGCAPHPAHIHQIPGRSRLKGRNHRFLSYSFSSRSPDPHHLVVLARPGFVRAAPVHPGTSRDRLPSAPPPCCDRVSGEGLSPPLAQTAPHGAHRHVLTLRLRAHRLAKTTGTGKHTDMGKDGGKRSQGSTPITSKTAITDPVTDGGNALAVIRWAAVSGRLPIAVDRAASRCRVTAQLSRWWDPVVVGPAGIS